jgi:hypothetical protein
MSQRVVEQWDGHAWRDLRGSGGSSTVNKTRVVTKVSATAATIAHAPPIDDDVVLTFTWTETLSPSPTPPFADFGPSVGHDPINPTINHGDLPAGSGLTEFWLGTPGAVFAYWMITAARYAAMSPEEKAMVANTANITVQRVVAGNTVSWTVISTERGNIDDTGRTLLARNAYGVTVEAEDGYPAYQVSMAVGATVPDAVPPTAPINGSEVWDDHAWRKFAESDAQIWTGTEWWPEESTV